MKTEINILSNLGIKFKFVVGIISLLIIAMVSLSVVFIKQSEHLLIKALEEKASLLNKNFSIVSAKAIQEYSFTNLQALIKEAASKDREIKFLVVADTTGVIIATSHDKDYPQFTKIAQENVLAQIEKKENIILRNRQEKKLESVRFIFSRDIPSGEARKPVGLIYIALDTTFLEEEITKLWTYSIILTMALMLLGVLVAYMFGASMTKPIGTLAQEVRIIASGNLDKSIQSGSRDEVGQLINDVEKMRLSIKDLTENLEAKVEERTKQLQEANEKIKEAMSALWGEMELAKKIQTVLLPVKPQLEGFDISASLEPADEVGGDYYDIISVEGYDWIVIGDVSGHGVPAGLIMMMVQTAIHTVLAKNPTMHTSQLLSIVNTTISENISRLGESKYMTITVLAGFKDGLFSFAGLHQDILIYRGATDKIEAIETRGMWIGIEPDISQMLPVDNLQLSIGDTMVLYTDGVTEATDSDGNMFGDDNLIDLIEANGRKSAAEIHKSVLDALEPYKKPDDVTIVVLKREI